MSNTIREDVVSISFDVENNPFAELTASMDKMKSAVTGGVDSSTQKLKGIAKGADGLKNSVQGATQAAQKADKTFTEMVKSARDIAKVKVSSGLEKLKSIPQQAKGQFDKLKSSVQKIKSIRLSDIGKGLDKGLGKAITSCKNGASKLTSGLRKAAGVTFDKVTSGVKTLATQAGKAAGSLAKISVKGLAVGAGAAAAAVGGLVTASVKAYANYEQLVGGVETLFKNSAPTVQKYANNAYKTAGLSANQYMETVTSFSASLLQSVGGDTEKAAAYADMAITDMSDNANKMGTDMESIQTAYQGFAKQNYTMLDNLKLGYGGTKEEMARLVKDAAKLDKSVDANSMSYANIVKAIHAVQEEMGILGTTQKEAEKTISGSLASMKSAWGNMLTALVTGGDSFDQCVDNLVQSVKTFAGNILPVIKTALSGVTDLIAELAPMIAAEIPALVTQLLPELVNAGISMVQSLIDAIASNTGNIANAAMQIISSLVTFISSAVPQLVTVAGQLITALAQGLAQQLPTLIPTIVQGILQLVDNIVNLLPQLVDAGIQLILGLAQGLINALPQLISYVPTIIQNLVDGITQSLPLIINAGIQLINMLVNGLVQNLPALIQAALQMIDALTQGLIQNLPVIIQGALSMIQALVQGLIQNLPMILQAAIELINGLCTGLLQNLPLLINMAIQLVLSLAQGLMQNVQMLISAAVQLIIALVQGILQNLPLIISAAIQILVALAVGLVQAIPQLIAVIPQIISAIIDGLMSVDWIQVGKDLIGGVWNGIKSIFGKGKENGKQAANSVASGINSSSYTATTAGTNLANSTTGSMQLNNTAISSYGAAGGSNLAAGISSTTGTATAAASSLANSTKTSLQLGDTTGIGTNAATGLASGISSNTGTATAAASSMSSQVKKAADTDIKVNVEADTKGINNVKTAVTGLVKAIQAQIKQVKPIFTSGFTAASTAATAQMTRLNTAVRAGTMAMLTTVRAGMNGIRSAIASCNLFSAGVNMMSGLNRGMASMRGTIIATARSIAASAANTINKELDIHSPSRVTMQSGEFTGQGLAIGMQNMKTNVTKSAQGLSTTAATAIKPSVQNYTPSSSSISNTSSNQTNNFNPQFTLNMNGASATETNKRKIKQWVKESIQETFESMERINPNLCEV